MEPTVTQTATPIHNYWVVFLIRGIFALLFGIAALAWPGLTLVFFAAMFGAFIIVDGVIGVVISLQERQSHPYWWAWLLAGIAAIILGVAVLFWPAITSLILFYLIAAWSFITGIMQIIAAFSPARAGQEWWLVISGIISILFALIIAAHPVSSILAIVWLIGLFAVIYSIVQFIRAFQFFSLARA